MNLNLKKVSKTIKANITGIGGSSQKLDSGTDPVNVINGDKDEGNGNTDNSIGPLQAQDSHIFISARDPWKWVMEDVRTQNSGGLTTITHVDTAQDLPSGKLAPLAALTAASNPSSSNTRRRRFQKSNTAMIDAKCTLRVEIVSNINTGNNDNSRPWSLNSFHCTSQAFDGLDDKDELARTIQRCRCEHMNLSPPSQLINWDVTKEECMNLVGDSLPCLSDSHNVDASQRIAVLKEPMGSRGTGVFFVRDANEIHSIIDEHRQLAVSEDGFLDNLIAQKGRIPSWVLQAEVKPCLLIRDRRKFHIRTYVVCVETSVLLDEPLDGEEEEGLMTTFIYNRHEIRIAGESVPVAEQSGERSRGAHITETFDRRLLQDEPELVKRNLSSKVESFVAKAFDALSPDMERRIAMSASALDGENEASCGSMVLPHKFAIAGLDLMVTEEEQIYLLEVNVNPAAPPAETVPNEFQSHLIGFLRDTMELVTSRTKTGRNNFYSTESVLQR